MSAVESLTIEVRVPLPIDFDGERLRWHGGDPVRSMVFNALSFAFPIGERFFMEAVRDGAAQVKSADGDALRQVARGFVGQEANHRRLHLAFNQWLAGHGLENRWERRLFRATQFIEDKGVLHRLAITTAYEHLTLMIADGILDGGWMAGADDRIRAMWEWHSAEEIEHRSVAHAIYRAAGGGYWRRVSWFLLVVLMLVTDLSRQTGHNLSRDRAWGQSGTWLGIIRFLWGRQGWAWALVRASAQYMSPWFDPAQYDDHGEAKRWIKDHLSFFR